MTVQSRIHEVWARLLSSSLEDRLRYAPSDCFETFPFPEAKAFAGLDDLGKKLHESRAAYMKAEQVGLTTTYNRLKDESETSPAIRTLRTLHEEVDRAVIAAYGWKDIPVPPYCAPPPAAWTAFEDRVLDELFKLNHERHEEEKRAGLATPATKEKKPTKKKPKAGA
ncbi:MAG: hypothetical protein JNM17_15145 [Archangium sp.]|nr:hypothetical protein [Archangium sp.]